MKKKELIIKYLFIFLLSISILITTLSIGIRITILNESFVRKEFTTSHYQKVEQNIKEEMKNSMISTGIDNSVIDDIFTVGDVKKSVEQTLSIIYENKNQTLDTSEIRKRLEANVAKDLEKHNYHLEDQKGYEHFIDSTIKIYTNEFIMLNQLPTVGSTVQKATKADTILALSLSMILLIIIIAKFKKAKHILPASLFTTSFVILFGSYYINKEAGLSSITIFSTTFSEVLRKIIAKTFTTFQYISYAYIIIGLMIIILCIREKHRHRHHHHHHDN